MVGSHMYGLPLQVRTELPLNFMIFGLMAGSSHASSVPSQVLSEECTRSLTCIILAATYSCAGDAHATVITDAELSIASWLWATFTDLKTSSTS